MMVRTACYSLVLAALAATATAGTPTFGFVRDIDYAPHPVVGNLRVALADASGGLILGDSNDDDVYYCADPLTTDGATDDVVNTGIALDTPQSYGSGLSFQNITSDGSLTAVEYWMSGRANATTGAYNLMLVTVFPEPPYSPMNLPNWSPLPADTSAIPGHSGATFISKSGSTTTLVAPVYDTCALQFISVDTGTMIATASGAAIANPNGTGYRALSATYYAAGGVIFVNMAKDLENRRIDYFTTDGTPGGTAYAGTFAAGVPSTVLLDGNASNTARIRAQLTVDPVEQILVAPVNPNLSADAGADNGWDVFDISTITTNETPYTRLSGPDLVPPSNLARRCSGSAFFSKAGTRYVALMAQTRMIIFELNPAPVFANGDADGDGEINVADATAVYNFAAGLGAAPAGDGDVAAPIGGVGQPDATDAAAIVQFVVNGVPFAP